MVRNGYMNRFSEIRYRNEIISEILVGKKVVWPEFGEIEIIIDQNEKDPDKIVQISEISDVDNFLLWFYNNSLNVLGKYVGDYKNGTGKLLVCPWIDTPVQRAPAQGGNMYRYFNGHISKWGDHNVGRNSAGDELIFPAEIYYKSEQIDEERYQIIFSQFDFSGAHKAFNGVAIGRQCCSSFWTNSDGNLVFGSNTSFGDCNHQEGSVIKERARNRGINYSMMNIDYRNIYTFLDILYSRSTKLKGTNYTGLTNQDTINRDLFNIISINYDRREFVDNVIINDYVAEVTHDDGVVEYLEIPRKHGNVSKLHIGEYLNIIPKELDASGYYDGFCGWVWTGNKENIVPVIGCENNNRGTRMLDMGLDGNPDSSQSSRIMYKGNVEICLDPEYFDDIPVLN